MEKVKTTAFLNVFETKLNKLIFRIKTLRTEGGDPDLIKRLITDAKDVRKTVRNMQEQESNGMRSREEIQKHLDDLLKDEHPTDAMEATIFVLHWILNDK